MSTTTGGRSLRSRVAAALAATGALVMAAGLVVLNASSATAGNDKTVHKSYVCKYVGTPGVDERLQTGQNPIWVDNHSLTGSPDLTYVGEEFSDAHGRSVVIVANTAKLDPEPSVADCPAVKPPPSTSPSVSPSSSPSSPGKVHKSYVCKYVGTPGVDERLQTGQNPIWVDNHSLTGSPDLTYVGEEFSDAQGRSVVIVANTPKLDPEPSVADCPAVKPSPSPSHSPSSSPSVSPSQSPSYSPSSSPSVSPSQSVSPSSSPSVSPSESVSPSQPASTSPSVAGTETVKPKPSHHPVSQPTVLGTQAVAPTAVEAGLSTWPPQRPASPTGTFVGAGLLGGGLLLLVSGGWLGLGGRKRGAHQA